MFWLSSKYQCPHRLIDVMPRDIADEFDDQPREWESSYECCWLTDQRVNFMKPFYKVALVFFMLLLSVSSKVNAYYIEPLQNNSQKIVSEKIAEKICSANEDHLFDGLENEKTLKFSYLRYIGIKDKEIFSTDYYDSLITQIREKCLISKNAERELREFFDKTLVD